MQKRTPAKLPEENMLDINNKIDFIMCHKITQTNEVY